MTGRKKLEEGLKILLPPSPTKEMSRKDPGNILCVFSPPLMYANRIHLVQFRGGLIYCVHTHTRGLIITV